MVNEKYKETMFESLIRQYVENGTFNSQNIFNDDYLKPQFYKYVKSLEEENMKLKEKLNVFKDMKSDMCSTKDVSLNMYLNALLIKYGEIV